MIRAIHSIRLIALFLLLSVNSVAQIADFGKSYVNITKSLTGGTNETGDTLEIRASFVVRSGTYDSCAFYDVIPAGTTYIPGSLKVLTNEGKIYQSFTDVAVDDAGWISGTNVRINLGNKPADGQATYYMRGRIRNTHKPNFASSCIQIASYRVKITAASGATINVGKGNFTYKNGINPLATFNFPNYYVIVYTNFGMCANVVGANTIGTEFNGTFGSGKPRNRGTSTNVPPSYTYRTFTTNTPNDYSYGIPNNTSTQTGYTTLNTWPKPDNSVPTHRVFNLWDIIGDHTGAASPTLGNPAADTVANSNAGYMLVVNAAYRIDSAFQQTITNLCPNTNYEISFWIRNICSRCGSDSNGVNAGSAGYIPTAPGDSSGVYPNLNIKINDTTYYGTGYIRYTGQWVKRGFTFKTGMTQTSLTLKIFNNASGGGGNDWALDDIAFYTCNPNINFSPDTLRVCQFNTAGFAGTVTSLFNTYTEWRWEKSTDNGATWTTDTTGSSVPVWNGTQYQYTVTHNPLTFTASDSGTRYRLIIATTSANLNNPSCAYNSGKEVIIIVNTTGACMLLPVNFVSLSVNKNNNAVTLQWDTQNEFPGIRYDIERSSNGTSFFSIGSLFSNGTAHYSFTDNTPIPGMNFYRIKASDTASGRIIYSHIVVINISGKRFVVADVINPFRETLKASITTAEEGPVRIFISNMQGVLVRSKEFFINNGINNISMNGLDDLPAGIYALHIEMKGQHDVRKIFKAD